VKVASRLMTWDLSIKILLASLLSEDSPLGLILSREPSGSVGTGVWPRTRTFRWRQTVVVVFRTVGQATRTEHHNQPHTSIYNRISTRRIKKNPRQPIHNIHKDRKTSFHKVYVTYSLLCQDTI